jgi:hypothetical protein
MTVMNLPIPRKQTRSGLPPATASKGREKMKNMNRIVIAFLMVSAGSFLYAQQAGEAVVGASDAQGLTSDVPQQELREISVDKFDVDGFWHSTMSSDEGITISRLFEGTPTGKEPLSDERDLGISDRYVLGTRVDFYRRGYSSITVRPSHPIPIEGITKTISLWVAGRNFNHDLNILIQDFRGNYYELYMGKLNFQGWKKMTVAVPPQPDDGKNGIVQRDYHYNNLMGIRVVGFRVDCDPDETYGTYYVYFDDLRAVTDLFAESSRDPDDMSDDW